MKQATLRSADDLISAGLIPVEQREDIARVASRYAVALPPALAELISGDADDPIVRQFVPSVAELETKRGELTDPIGDETHSPVEGIVHRYPDRVLLKLVSICAVYCRFCFRREMVGPGKSPALSKRALGGALDYIRADKNIWEVILTGGDPLILSPRRLREIAKQIAEIEHVKILRVHTRMPVADPSRVTVEMARALRASGKAVYVVLHANHARELTAAAREACARLIDTGIVMLNQSVLLRGVNDDPQTMAELLRALVECRIKPYYLHHGDLAPGTSHLRTSIEEGQALMRQLRGRVSGLCQPDYVLDIPGGHGKSPVGPNYLSGFGSDLQVEDFNGERHRYRDGETVSLTDGGEIHHR
jgi:lysine 2,3-aminomutase